jgi:hypothetical protein
VFLVSAYKESGFLKGNLKGIRDGLRSKKGQEKNRFFVANKQEGLELEILQENTQFMSEVKGRK